MPETGRVYKGTGSNAKTKLQRKCLELQETLPPLTEAQVAWARKVKPKVGYRVARGRNGKHTCIWCQVCGQMDEIATPKYTRYDVLDNETALHKILDNETERKHICSGCGTKISITRKTYNGNWEYRDWTGTTKENKENYSVGFITTHKGMQVVRIFNFYTENCMGSKTQETFDEVFCIWLDPETKKKTIVSKPYTRGFYHFRWSPEQPWKISQDRYAHTYYSMQYTYNLLGFDYYPRMKVLPILKRNGWNNSLLRIGVECVETWKVLLTDPAAEGLIKAGQIKAFEYWMQTGGRFGRYSDKTLWLPCIRICNRRKYKVQDASMWFDNLAALLELGMDTHSPKYICPDDLNALHDMLQAKLRKKREQERKRRELNEARSWEEKYAEAKGRYFPITFDNGRIYCHVIQSVEEMHDEGTHMHHCVFDMGYYKRPESLILSARDQEGNRLETVEVSLKTFRVVQSRALGNKTTPEHSDIVALVTKNMFLIRNAKKQRKNEMHQM